MISVLVVNYQSAADLAELMASVSRHSGRHEVELVVTNNSAGERIRRPRGGANRVTVLSSPNRGFAAGVNLAFRESRGDILMLANPDVRVTTRTFDAAVAYLESHPTVGVLLPLLRYPSGEMQFSVRRFYTWSTILYARSPFRMMSYRPRFFRRYLYEDLDRSAPVEVDWGLGAAMFLRRADCEENDIFDERFFMYFEDVDLCYRMWQRGRLVTYSPQIECIHAHRRFSRNPLSAAGWHHLQSLKQFITKHGGLPQRPQAQSS